MKLLHIIVPAGIWLALALSGCRPATGPATAKAAGPGPIAAKPASAAPAPVSEADLAKAGVNEAGQVAILEYHNIRAGKTNYDRTPEAFRKDLETLYREGYRPVSLHDYLDNRIDVPLGMSPVILTFDDSSRTQFHYLTDGSLDPDCAFGIIKAFHEAHPDFAMRGVFYMNASPTGKPAPVFGDQESAAKKVTELLAAGMEIGNHTVSHPKLKRLPEARVQKELADCVAGVHALAPEAVVNTLALPFGMWPANKKLAEAGEADGVKYNNRAVLLVGANPAPAPSTSKFNPLRLPRVQAYDGEMGSTYWFAQFRQHTVRRYVSDGDPAIVTVAKGDAPKIDTAKLADAKLRTY